MAYFNLADYFYDIVYENSEETVLIYEREKTKL